MPVKANPFLDKLKKIPLAIKDKIKKNKNSKSKKEKTTKNKSKKGKMKKFKSPLLNLLHGIYSTLGNVFLLFVLMACIVGVVVCDKVLEVVENAAEIDPTTIEASLNENSMIVDQNGAVLETLIGNDGRRTLIEFEDINQNMVDAIIAIEDKTYYDHKGFSYKRLVGAALASLRSGEGAIGTSTITQQLAKNLYLNDDRSMDRKIEEAYYAILLERNLTKDQIMWAYLNRVAFGLNTYGVESAANFYFSKSAKDLTFIESVMLAGIPKSPAAYAPISRLPKALVTDEHIIYDDHDPTYTLVYNPKSQDRFIRVLNDMYNNDMITKEQHDLINISIIDYINPTLDQSDAITSFFGDMVKDEAAALLAEHFDVSLNVAAGYLYNRGYIIESTIDYEIQSKLEQIYGATLFTTYYDGATYSAVKRFQEDNGLDVDGHAGPITIATLIAQTSFTEDDFIKGSYTNKSTHSEVATLKKALDELSLLTNEGMFPRPTVVFNSEGHILNDITNKVILFKKESLINDENQMVINRNNFYYDDNDDLVILKDKGYKFYQQDIGVQVEMEDMFVYDKGTEEANYIDGRKFYNISGLYKYEGSEVMIPREFTSKVDGNLVIDKSMFSIYPDYFKEDADGNLVVDELSANNGINYYRVPRGVIQPQSAFVLLDHHTGEIKAIIGGRDTEGKNIFNRALSPQQPGSSIKPIGAYTAAIKSGQFTAASVFDDVPSYLNSKKPDLRWPFNWYETYNTKYFGRQTLRQALEDSVNVVAVKLVQEIGERAVVDQLKSLGITTIVESGPSNDMGPASLALGGMTKGITPLELTTAYATYANQGVYNKPITVSKITDLAGNIILENKPETRVVMSEQVAYIMQDLMVSAVTTGVSNAANFDGMTVAGKTGTTSDNRDALFIGYTPYYTAGVWFGNDVKIKMEDGSISAAKFWKSVMSELHTDLPDIGFDKPDGLVQVSVDRVSGKRPGDLSSKDPAGSQVYKEYFLPNTAPTETDDAHEIVTICLDNDLHVLATEYCKDTAEVVLRTRLDEYDFEKAVNKYGNPLLTKDYLLTVPYLTCELHTSETIDINVAVDVEDVIKTIAVGDIRFIRDYNLLLHSGEFVFIPVDSQMLIDYTIVMPDGTEIPPEAYNILFVTKPELQIEEVYKRTLESQDPPADETEDDSTEE